VIVAVTVTELTPADVLPIVRERDAEINDVEAAAAETTNDPVVETSLES